MVNLFLYENHIRLIIGMFSLGFVGFAEIWWLALPAAGLIYTGALRYCPAFHLAGINSDKAGQEYHLSLLPQHNSEPVYL